MAHQKHTHVRGGIYLVSSIGEHRQRVFLDDGDRAALSELVAQVITRCSARIHAFVWLDSEILLIAQVFDVSMSGVMQRIGATHARRINEKLGYRGYLFQHPHRSILLEDSVTVLEAVARLHRIPGKWSSHLAYLGLEDVPWLTRDVVLELLSDTPEAHRIAFPEFVASAKDSRAGVSRPYDEFLTWHRRRCDERRKPASLDQVIHAVARWLCLDPVAIKSAESDPLLSFSRAIIAWTAMQNGIASLADIGRQFHRGRSTLHETREKYRVRAPQLFGLHLSEILEGPAIAVSEVLRLVGVTPAERYRRSDGSGNGGRTEPGKPASGVSLPAALSVAPDCMGRCQGLNIQQAPASSRRGPREKE